MKKEIHPQYFPEAEIKCACGAVFQIGATQKTMEVEICSRCHPFFTGQEKLVDTAGRVERLKAKIKKSEEIKAQRRKTSATPQKSKTASTASEGATTSSVSTKEKN